MSQDANPQTGDLLRARNLLARPGVWIDAEATAGGYAVRQSPDRRGRVVMRLDDARLAALIASPGLRPRAGGGWTMRTPVKASGATAPDLAGRPGVVEGLKSVVLPDGAVIVRRANLGQCPLVWLSRRTDDKGRPLLSPAERAAGERLRLDAERSLRGTSVTQRWDGLPRQSSGSAARTEPGAATLSATRRVALALEAVSARSRALVQRVCLNHDGLQAAETELGLRRRQGRRLLQQGLAELARHYGIG